MTMRVVGRTIKEHRRDRRRSQEIPAELNGTAVRITDLSLGGAAAGPENAAGDIFRDLREGDLAYLRMPRSGAHSQVLTVEVARCTGTDGRVGLRFRTLDDGQYRLVEQLVLRPSKILGPAAETA